MKNKVDSKDYQPIRFHKGKAHLASQEKPGAEKDLNEDDPRRENLIGKADDSKVVKTGKEITKKEKENNDGASF